MGERWTAVSAFCTEERHDLTQAAAGRMDWSQVETRETRRRLLSVQVGQDQVEGGGGCTLQPASALLIIPSREVQSGSFSTGGFWSSLQSQKCDGRPPVSSADENEDFWAALSLVSSRGRCGTVSAGFKGTDPVGP